jgi:YfiH family protein
VSAGTGAEGGGGASGNVAPYDEIDVFDDWGMRALTTTRGAGSFSTAGTEPVGEVLGRWARLREELGAAGQRFATASQVHGGTVLTHGGGWRGWLRADAADGHLTLEPATSFAVTVADCVPVFVAHPSGAAALLHAGWRGTVAGILPTALRLLAARGLAAADLRVHLGPSICGACYEVSPDVHARITGRTVDRPTPVDLRAVLADQARAAGVAAITTSPACTRCHGERFFSHRAGDAGRQLGVLATPA